MVTAARLKGFTLIEMLLVMVVLSILAVSSFAFINSSYTIYAQGVERQEVVAQTRFLITRLSKELRHATPNSIRLTCDNAVNGNCSVSQCLEFTPFLSATHYTDYLPTSSPFSVNAVDFELNNLTRPSIGDWAVVYPLNADDIYNTNNNKRLQLTGYTQSPSSALDQWQFSQAFAEESPSKRLYLLDSPVSFCLEGSQLYRYANYGFYTDQLTASELNVLAGVKRGLLGQYLANDVTLSPLFKISELTLARNSVVNILLHTQFNERETMRFSHEVHIPNVP